MRPRHRDREIQKILRIQRLLDNGYDVDEGGRLVHREIYKQVYGSIPRGWVIHHVDGNKENNSIANLVALPRKLHDRIHASCVRNGQRLPSKTDVLKQRDSVVLLEFQKKIKALEQQIERCKAEREEYKKQSETEAKSVAETIPEPILAALEIPKPIAMTKTILRKSGSSSYR